MKRILLVEPKAADFNIYSLVKIPRMGLAILGTMAHAAGYEVRIIFQEAVALRREHILWADLVGFSLLTSTAQEGYRLARMVRSLDSVKNSSTVIVFGGVHATFRPEECLESGDYVLRGEADLTFVPFLNALRDGGSFQDLHGLSWKEEERVRHNPLPPGRTDMDSLPTPDWSLYEPFKRDVQTVMTSRGCPYDCSFCSVTAMLGRKYRMRNLDLVMEDVRSIKKGAVFFYDDHFAANPQRTKELLRRLIGLNRERNGAYDFSAQVRSDIGKDPEMLDLMREAGFTNLYIGFESINPRSLELYNKKQSLGDIQKSIIEIHKRGIWVHGMFVFGSDADTPAGFAETVKFAQKSRLKSVQFLILTPFPGTRFFRQLKAQGRMLSYDWSRYDAFNTLFLPRRMTPYELQKGNIRATKRFYSLGRIVYWLLKGQFLVALVHLYARWTLFLWHLNNRKQLRQLKQDSREVFQLSQSGQVYLAGVKP